MSDLDVAPPQKPDWLSALIAHRDEFEGAALYSGSAHPDGSVIFKLALAISQPQRAIFLQCERCQVSASGVSQQSVGGVQMPVHRPDSYQYGAMRFVDHQAVPWLTKEDIWVIPEVIFHGFHVHTAALHEPWAVFTRYHHSRRPVPSAKAEPAHPRSRVRVDPDMLAALQSEYPWLSLAELQSMVSTKASATVGGSAQSSSAQSSTVAAAEVPETVFVAVAADLQALRDEVADGQPEVQSHFHVKVLGGDWSVSRFGKVCTDIGSFPKDKSTQLWCKAVGWPPSPGQKSFAVSKFGMEGSRQLAEELCCRANYFMSSWVAAGSPSPFAFQDLAAAYRLRPEFQSWLDDLPLNSEVAKAALVISGLVPLPVPE